MPVIACRVSVRIVSASSLDRGVDKRVFQRGGGDVGESKPLPSDGDIGDEIGWDMGLIWYLKLIPTETGSRTSLQQGRTRKEL